MWSPPIIASRTRDLALLEVRTPAQGGVLAVNVAIKPLWPGSSLVFLLGRFQDPEKSCCKALSASAA